MATNEHIIKVPGMMKNLAVGGHLTTADQVLDAAIGKEQSQINAETATAISNEASRAEAAEELLRQAYEALTQSDIVVGDLPASGEVATIYRVPGESNYKDYMWHGTQFVEMAEYDNAIDDEPTAESNNIAKSGGIVSIMDKSKNYDTQAYSYHTNDSISVGAVLVDGTIDSNPNYGHVFNLELEPLQTIFLKDEFYTGSNVAVIFETQQDGTFIKPLIKGSGERGRYSFTNFTGNKMYIGICGYPNNIDWYYINTKVKVVASEESELLMPQREIDGQFFDSLVNMRANYDGKLLLSLCSFEDDGKVHNRPNLQNDYYTRAACKSYIQAPFSVSVATGYVVYLLFRYTVDANGNVTYIDYVRVNNQNASVTDKNYVYRFNIKKQDDSVIYKSDLSNVVTNFINCSDYLYLSDNALKNSVYGGKILNVENFDIDESGSSVQTISTLSLASGIKYYLDVHLYEASKAQMNIWIVKVLRGDFYARIILKIGNTDGHVTFSVPDSDMYILCYRLINANDPGVDYSNVADFSIETTSLSSLQEEVDSIEKEKFTNKYNLNPLNSLLDKKYFDHFGVAERLTIPSNNIIVPSQSLFNIQVSKRLGFNCIELNVHFTSDGYGVCFHGNGGKFDNQFELTDNPVGLFATTPLADIKVSDVTLSEIQQSVVNRAKYVKYKLPPITLQDALYECKKLGIIPLVTTNINTVDIIEGIMGSGNYIAYIGSEKKISDDISKLTSAPISVWDSGSQTVDEIYENVSAIDNPVIYGWTGTNSLSLSELREYVSTMHKMGKYVNDVPNYRSEAYTQTALEAGVDTLCSGWNIPDFGCGNICNLSGDVDYTMFSTNGTISNENVVLSNGQKVNVPTSLIKHVFIGGGYLTIRYIGTLKVKMGRHINREFNSDDSEKLRIFSSAFLDENAIFELTAVGSVTIKELQYKASEL